MSFASFLQKLLFLETGWKRFLTETTGWKARMVGPINVSALGVGNIDSAAGIHSLDPPPLLISG